MGNKKEKKRGYFNALADASFKKNPDGKGWLYYPNGILSKGRVVEDERTKDKLFMFQKSMYMVLLPLGALYGVYFSLSELSGRVLLLPAIILIAVYFWLHLQIRKLPKSKVKLKYRESTAKAMRGLPNWYSRALLIISSLLIGFAALTPYLFNRPFEKVSTLTLLLIGLGVFGIVISFTIQKFRQKLDREYPPEVSEENVSQAIVADESKEKSTRVVKPAYIVILVIVAVLLIAVKLMNPNKKYSTQEYWLTATIESVNQVPEKTLKPGNRNGGVLMWAAMATSDLGIISALVERGAEINEHDQIFSGTPLTGAAGYSKYPEMIKHLVSLGADINERIYGSRNTALHIAAMYNPNPGIIEELVSQGADVNDENSDGETALDVAIQYKNQIAIESLTRLMKTDE